jgi:antitoxin ParD1/3/4
MARNTSISLGDYFNGFIEEQVASGRFSSASEVVRAGLRLLEREEKKMAALRQALQEGLDSGEPTPFDFDEFLAEMHAEADAEQDA